MKRTLLVPAAGLGTRLGSSVPKLLTPVAGRAMIDHVLSRHAPHCADAVVVVHPSARDAAAAHLSRHSLPAAVVVQPEPTGMLDAILCGVDEVLSRRPDRIWISWCDQIAISRQTARELARRDSTADAPAVVLPTTTQRPPYIHFQRNEDGRVVRVLQAREGDDLPEVGESDAGLFSLSRSAFAERLPEYARDVPERGRRTGERNFLPFLAWLSRTARVESFSIDAVEARGVNTPADVAAIEAHLARAEPHP